MLAQTVFGGLLLGCVYALVAAGLSLIFGVMDIVNFAHGEFLMLAMFLAYWAWHYVGLDPLLSTPVAALILAVAGAFTYKFLIRRVLKAPMVAQVFCTFGLGVFLSSSAQFFWSPNFRVVEHSILGVNLRLGPVHTTAAELVAGALSLLGFALLYWLLTRTALGWSLQATSEDKEAAALIGIDTEAMFTLGWALGLGCVGIAGGILASYYYVYPGVGGPFSTMAYVAVALGGFGNVAGALVGGLTVGLVESLTSALVSPYFKYVGAFVAYLIAVSVRPQGLFGKF